MAYTTVAEVANHLGKTFTPAQEAECYSLLAAADAWINGRTGRSYPQTSLITDELHTIEGPYLYLRHPIGSVTSVEVRSPDVGAADTVLTVGSGYEVLDPVQGVLRLSGGYVGWDVRVTYLPALPLDARLSLAAKLFVTHFLRPILDGVTPGIKSYSVGQELTVTYADGAVKGIPDELVALVDSVNPTLVFA